VTFVGNEPIPPKEVREKDCDRRGAVSETFGPFRRVEVTDLRVLVKPAKGREFVLAEREVSWWPWELRDGLDDLDNLLRGRAWVFVRVSAAGPVGEGGGRHPRKRAG
jgi:hypothetical protein